MSAHLRVLKGGLGPEHKLITATVTLTPSQQRAMDKLAELVGHTNCIGISSDPGMGRTTLIGAAAARFGGDLVTIADLSKSIQSSGMGGADHWDLAVYRYLRERLLKTDLLLIDGLQMFAARYFTMRLTWARQDLMDVILRLADEHGKTIILSGGMASGAQTIHEFFYRWEAPVAEIAPFGVEDYEMLAAHFLGRDRSSRVDFRKVYRFASTMNAHDLRIACGIANLRDDVDTAAFISIVDEFISTANTRTDEVEAIRFDTMPGMEQISDALETHVVLPLTDSDLAEEFDLRAKRGVLLYGPPGTGKTSVGRALAHRLKGRFFLIDGSVKTEPAWTFHARVSAIIREAIDNAPSVLFIDDADVLFDISHAVGFGRYLLTLLDGLSGESAAKVCVMMTAMDASKVPEAVLRSGRVELWLETKMPPPEVRAGIVKRWVGEKLPGAETIDFDLVAKATEGFTPADLRRIAGDARAYYAADIDAGRPRDGATDYIQRAIEAVVATREAMAINLADPSLRLK